MKITVDGKRYDLSTMVALGASARRNGGTKLEEMYFGKISHRIIIEYDSIWEDRDHPGACVGTVYAVVEPGDTFETADESWVQTMQRALDLCDSQHETMLNAAMDEHAPA